MTVQVLGGMRNIWIDQIKLCFLLVIKRFVYSKGLEQFSETSFDKLTDFIETR